VDVSLHIGILVMVTVCVCVSLLDNFIDGENLISLTNEVLLVLVPEIGLKKKLCKLLGLSGNSSDRVSISLVY